MSYINQAINNLNTIDLISSKLDGDLTLFFNRSTSITIAVHNAVNNEDLSHLKESPSEFEKYIASLRKKINTLNMMMLNIDKISGNPNITQNIRRILNDVERQLKEMSFKIFYLSKAISTNNIIELRVVSVSFTADINKLKEYFKSLKNAAYKTKLNILEGGEKHGC